MSRSLNRPAWWASLLLAACDAQSGAQLSTDGAPAASVHAALSSTPAVYGPLPDAPPPTAGAAAPGSTKLSGVYNALDGQPLEVNATWAPASAASPTAPTTATGDRVWTLELAGFATLRIARSAAASAPQSALQSEPIYMCPTQAEDNDRDGICDLAEVRYGTDAASADTDGDALSDAAELYGGFDGGVMYDIKSLGANPKHKDVFVQLDYVDGFEPASGVKAEVEAAFEAAPLHNPDGIGGIHLLIDVAQAALPAAVVPDVILGWDQVEDVKRIHFDTNRRYAFHYALFAKHYWTAKNTSSGLATLPGADLLVTLDGWGLDKMDAQHRLMTQAGTLMHELGHNLGLDHGGFPMSEAGTPATQPDAELYKPHYLSIMNYNYQTDGLPIDGQARLDYARYAVQGISELGFFEPDGFIAANGNSRTDLTHYAVYLCTDQGNDSKPPSFSELLLGTASAELDLNRNGIIDREGKREKDLNGNKKLEVFAGLDNDWEHLDFSGIRPRTGVSRVISSDHPCASAPVSQRVPNNEPDVSPLPGTDGQTPPSPDPTMPAMDPEPLPEMSSPSGPELPDLPENPAPPDAP